MAAVIPAVAPGTSDGLVDPLVAGTPLLSSTSTSSTAAAAAAAAAVLVESSATDNHNSTKSSSRRPVNIPTTSSRTSTPPPSSSSSSSSTTKGTILHAVPSDNRTDSYALQPLNAGSPPATVASPGAIHGLGLMNVRSASASSQSSGRMTLSPPSKAAKLLGTDDVIGVYESGEIRWSRPRKESIDSAVEVDVDADKSNSPAGSKSSRKPRISVQVPKNRRPNPAAIRTFLHNWKPSTSSPERGRQRSIPQPNGFVPVKAATQLGILEANSKLNPSKFTVTPGHLVLGEERNAERQRTRSNSLGHCDGHQRTLSNGKPRMLAPSQLASPPLNQSPELAVSESSMSNCDDDDQRTNPESLRSSMTSLDPVERTPAMPETPEPMKAKLSARHSRPVEDGPLSSSMPKTPGSAQHRQSLKNKPLPPSPPASTSPPLEPPQERGRTPSTVASPDLRKTPLSARHLASRPRHERNSSTASAKSTTSQSSTHQHSRSRNVSASRDRLSEINKQFLESSPPQLFIEPTSNSNSSAETSKVTSPTLSEAARDLEHHLSTTTIGNNDRKSWLQDPLNLCSPARANGEKSPFRPDFSSRRSASEPMLSKTLSDGTLEPDMTPKAADDSMPLLQPVAFDPSKVIVEPLSPEIIKHIASPIAEEDEPVEARSPTDTQVTADAAEAIIVHIMRSLDSLEDLFKTAIINRGFYRIFKRHELSLIKDVLRTSSAPSWEHLEFSPAIVEEDMTPNSAAPMPEYTPTTYLQCYTRDLYIIAALKQLVLDHCQSLLRAETVTALTSTDPDASARIDNAFWRIWTFCRIFGPQKNREDDMAGQLDWLRGGLLVHGQTCTSSVAPHDTFDMNSVLLTAPDCFGRGNGEGLTAEQLYDMTELWTCFGFLLQGLHRPQQAREHGIFDECADVKPGDTEAEEILLEEWIYFVRGLGLNAILELATLAQDPGPAAFRCARDKGMTVWSPPALNSVRKPSTSGNTITPSPASRGRFLKDAVSRVYEEKIARVYANTSPERQRHRLQGRRRNTDLRNELRALKATSSYQRTPYLQEERPWSEVDRGSVISPDGYFGPRGTMPQASPLPIPHRQQAAAAAAAANTSTTITESPEDTTPVQPGSAASSNTSTQSRPNLGTHFTNENIGLPPATLPMAPPHRPSFARAESGTLPDFGPLQSPPTRMVPIMYHGQSAASEQSLQPDAAIGNTLDEIISPHTIAPTPGTETPADSESEDDEAVDQFDQDENEEESASAATPRAPRLRSHLSDREMRSLSQLFVSGGGEEAAIRQLVEMGFVEEEAKKALKRTASRAMSASADSIRPERAIEYLLQQGSIP